MRIIGKKSIFNANFTKAQKTMDISRAKELLKSNLLSVHEDSESYTEREAQHLERIMNILTAIRKHREQEVALIFSDCEDLYLTKKFELAEHLLGFAETIVERSGLHNWRTKVDVLHRKIKRSREIIDKLRKFYTNNPMSLPIVQIQQNFENLEMLFQNVQGDDSRQDAIHPDIITEFENIIQELEKFMHDHGIPKIGNLDKKSSTVWAYTKANLDQKSKETKLKRLINAATKTEDQDEAQAGVLKAYKLIQENPYLFSLQQKQETIDLLEKYGKKIEAASEIQADLFREANILTNSLYFDRALMKLQEHRETHGKALTAEEMDDLDGFHENIAKNQEIFLKLQAVETQLEHNDVLGAKTAFIKFNKFFNNLSKSVTVISTLENRIALLLTALGEYSSKEPQTPSTAVEFDPFGDIEKDKDEKEVIRKEFHISEKVISDVHFIQFRKVLDEKGQISKQELATTLKLSEEEVFTNLFSWKKHYEFEVVGSEIFSKAALSALSSASSKSSSPDSQKLRKSSERNLDEEIRLDNGQPEENEEEILETLDDLLNTDL
ncbi:MAG: hypothetical protein ACTSYI_03985 [Promethearchaeota archaeon]